MGLKLNPTILKDQAQSIIDNLKEDNQGLLHALETIEQFTGNTDLKSVAWDNMKAQLSNCLLYTSGKRNPEQETSKDTGKIRGSKNRRYYHDPVTDRHCGTDSNWYRYCPLENQTHKEIKIFGSYKILACGVV